MNKRKVLKSDHLFMDGKNRLMTDWSHLFEHLFVEGTVDKADAKRLILAVNKYLSRLIRK